MWKLSKYNIIHSDSEETTIYNLISGGMLNLDKEYSSYFNQYMTDRLKHSLPQSLEHALSEGNMIVPEEFDEIAYLKVLNNMSRFNSYNLGLTIATTTKCNFTCSYCYEKNNIDYIDMTQDIRNQTVNFIKQYMADYKHLFITWYGGEPLLDLDSIRKISVALFAEKIEFSASMVSNGYNLCRNVAMELAEYNVKNIQITLDGPPEIHDKRRYLKGKKGTFNRILENIAECCDVLPIIIRINVDKDNIKFIPELFKIFDLYNLKNKISVYISPVDIKDGTVYDQEKCFNNNEFALEFLELYKLHINNGYISPDIYSLKCVNCGAVSSNSFVIDPLGDIYKCWDDIGIKEEKVGTIFRPREITSKSIEWLNYNVFENSECATCEVLPICMGGCPNRPIKGKIRNCNQMKYVINDYVELLKSLKVRMAM